MVKSTVLCHTEILQHHGHVLCGCEEGQWWISLHQPSTSPAPAQPSPAPAQQHTGLAKYGQWPTHQHGDFHECGVIDSRKFGHNNNIIRG